MSAKTEPSLAERLREIARSIAHFRPIDAHTLHAAADALDRAGDANAIAEITGRTLAEHYEAADTAVSVKNFVNITMAGLHEAASRIVARIKGG